MLLIVFFSHFSYLVVPPPMVGVNYYLIMLGVWARDYQRGSLSALVHQLGCVFGADGLWGVFATKLLIFLN